MGEAVDDAEGDGKGEDFFDKEMFFLDLLAPFT